MYHVSAQGVDERMINGHYYYYYYYPAVFWFSQHKITYCYPRVHETISHLESLQITKRDQIQCMNSMKQKKYPQI